MGLHENRIDKLRSIMVSKSPGFVSEAETVLADINDAPDPSAIGGLLRLLDDAGPDELMFSIVHTIERWDDEAYGEAILESVEYLWTSAPRWAQILHIRIINAKATADAYLHVAGAASPSQRSTVRAICNRIVAEWPNLTPKVNDFVHRLGP